MVIRWYDVDVELVVEDELLNVITFRMELILFLPLDRILVLVPRTITLIPPFISLEMIIFTPNECSPNLLILTGAVVRFQFRPWKPTLVVQHPHKGQGRIFWLFDGDEFFCRGSALDWWWGRICVYNTTKLAIDHLRLVHFPVQRGADLF